jgi:Mg-chelatase subunit ChlD
MPSAAQHETVLSSLLSAVHGKERREERGIEKIDLQRARKYGMRERARNGCYKYTYCGVVFVYDPKSNSEVTSWVSSDVSDDSDVESGTRMAKPVMLKKKEVHLSLIEKRRTIREKLLKDKKIWTSHSVLVVDMSGSMRKDDVNGSRCRSDGVWMSLARDYIKIPLENGTRRETDVISVIIMREEAEILLACEPTDWCLYNKFLDLREWEQLKPYGHGFYMPALVMAQKILDLNTKGSCALALLFFSDGKPSDKHENHAATMGSLASKFGRRLSITCIGMASAADNETFSTLRDMAYEAASYGSLASFGSASLDVESLSKIISSLASSLTETKTEMTDMNSNKSMTVRMDIRRERKGTPDDLNLTGDWIVYNQSRYGRSWIWSYENDDYAEIFDFRCLTCNEDARIGADTVQLKKESIVCEGCRCACFCSSQCFVDGYSDHVIGNIWNVEKCAHMRQAGIEKR